MWNDWVANAKKMAADVDRKLNESVGLDADGKIIGSPPPSTEVPKEDPVEETDAWNEDFDFGDDDDDEQIPEDTAVSNDEPVVTEEDPKNATIATEGSTVPVEKSLPVESNVELSQPIESPDDDTLETTIGQKETVDGSPDDDTNDSLPETTKMPLDTKEEDTSNDATEDPERETESPVEASPVNGLFSTVSSLAQTADSLLPSAATPNSAENDEQKAPFESEEETNTEEKKDTEDDDPQNSEPAGESQESGEDPPPPSDLPLSLDDEPQDPTPTPLVVTSPKVGVGRGIFSNLTTLAQTADSMLTAVIESKPESDSPVEKKDVNAEGWDEEEDALFVDDDEPKDESQSPESVEAADTKDSTLSEESPSMAPQEDDQESPQSELVSAASPESNVQETTPVVPNDDVNIENHPAFLQLRETLRLREEQLMDKGSKLNELQLQLETREEQYKQKLNDTKEEAKKRILRAKERCEAAEAKLKARSAGDSEDLKKKQLIIDELMQEGQALAQKQSAMEQSVRSANSEMRGLRDQLDGEIQKNEEARDKILELQTEIKSLKGYLSSAREGESQAGKLEKELLESRTDAEEKANTILSLQQRVKELTAESKELKQEVDSTRKSAAHEAQQEKTSMRREHNDLISDLEQKLRTTEREAGVREDALRHEVSEIRKRWQDAVRRADALSMDIQSSTAPLLRQLESMERQSRLRTANAAELESRLRSDLEEATIEKERLGKDCTEFKSKLSRLERSMKERDDELGRANKTVDDQLTTIESLTRSQEKLEAEAEKREIEYARIEKLANEGVSRVRSEMTQTVIDSEERYRGQIEKLESELKVEREKRSQLEEQVNQLLENVTGGVFASPGPQSTGIRRESKPKKLHKAEGQAEILAGALGLMDDSDDSEDEDDFDLTGMDHSGRNTGGSFSSFAALEQLTSRLKTAEVELASMRKSLKESNETRQALVEELGEARHAKEKLPLFEQKVKELTQENREMEREIAGLKADIADVRELYRTQLNVLLEEKTAAAAANNGNGISVQNAATE